MFQQAYQWFQSNFFIGIALFGVAFCAISAILGRIEPIRAIQVIAGIIVLAGASTIVAALMNMGGSGGFG